MKFSTISVFAVLIIAVSVFTDCASSRKVKPPSKISRFLNLLKKDNSTTRSHGTPCPDNYFRCVTSGVCIQSYFKCDGHDECGDNSDEANCPKPKCQNGQVPCANNVWCMDPSWRCDGDNDCGDFSDEKDCDKKPRESIIHVPVVRNVLPQRVKCSSDLHTCDDGTECILQSWVCDGGIPDCDDGSDELNCLTRPCYPDRFKCADTGRCIRGNLRCNYQTDCGDGSDEVDCPPMTCPPDYFKCLNVSKCVPNASLCDGFRDCEDRSDETGCESRECPPERPVRCQSTGSCRFEDTRCDGVQNCKDGSDELNCQSEQCPPDRPLRCESTGVCLTTGHRCNGYALCEDASDELNCQVPTKNESILASDYYYDSSDFDATTASGVDISTTVESEVGDDIGVINEVLAASTHSGEDDTTYNGESSYGWEQRRKLESLKKIQRRLSTKSRKALYDALERIAFRSV